MQRNLNRVAILTSLILFVFGITFANAASLNFTNATNVLINGNTYVISAGSGATSMTTDTSTLTVTVPGGSTFTLSSANGYTLNTNASLVSTCSSGVSSILIDGNITPSTIIITPSVTSTCPGTTQVSTTSGSGYVGVGSKTSTNTTTTNNNTSTTSTTDTSTNSGPSTYNFGTAVLKNGSKGVAVKELQRFLNNTMKLGLVIDGKLGPKTIAVIKKWQKAHGLVADGLVGPKTKAKMKASVK